MVVDTLLLCFCVDEAENAPDYFMPGSLRVRICSSIQNAQLLALKVPSWLTAMLCWVKQLRLRRALSPGAPWLDLEKIARDSFFGQWFSITLSVLCARSCMLLGWVHKYVCHCQKFSCNYFLLWHINDTGLLDYLTIWEHCFESIACYYAKTKLVHLMCTVFTMS